MPPPPGIRPGDWVQPAPGMTAALHDNPDMTGRMSASPSGWLPIGVPVMVLGVLLGSGGHERVLVLHGEGKTGWCWGGYLARVQEDA